MSIESQRALEFIGLAVSLFMYGLNEVRKKEQSRLWKIIGWLSITVSTAYFIWLIFLRKVEAAVAYAPRSWHTLCLGIAVLGFALFWIRGPKRFRSTTRALLYLIIGLLLIALGLGLIGQAIAQFFFC